MDLLEIKKHDCSNVPENTDIIEKSIICYYNNSMLHTAHSLRYRYIWYTEHLRI